MEHRISQPNGLDVLTREKSKQDQIQRCLERSREEVPVHTASKASDEQQAVRISLSLIFETLAAMCISCCSYHVAHWIVRTCCSCGVREFIQKARARSEELADSLAVQLESLDDLLHVTSVQNLQFAKETTSICPCHLVAHLNRLAVIVGVFGPLLVLRVQLAAYGPP